MGCSLLCFGCTLNTRVARSVPSALFLPLRVKGCQSIGPTWSSIKFHRLTHALLLSLRVARKCWMPPCTGKSCQRVRNWFWQNVTGWGSRLQLLLHPVCGKFLPYDCTLYKVRSLFAYSTFIRIFDPYSHMEEAPPGPNKLCIACLFVSVTVEVFSRR